jgi:hypothetical protein
MTIAFWDKACYWTERVGDWLSTPWFRLSRYCYARWMAAGGPERDWKRE